MPARSTKSAETAKPARPTAKKRSPAPRAGTRGKPRQPDHSQIAERAYLIHLEDGAADDLANWLRAERELKAA